LYNKESLQRRLDEAMETVEKKIGSTSIDYEKFMKHNESVTSKL